MCVCVRTRARESISLPLCFSAWEDFTLSESAEWEQLLLLGTCRQIAMAASYQCTSHSKNTLQMTSFCAPTNAPFLQPSALLHLLSKMNLLPGSALICSPLFDLTWQWGKQVVDPGVVLCCFLTHDYIAQFAEAGTLRQLVHVSVHVIPCGVITCYVQLVWHLNSISY